MKEGIDEKDLVLFDKVAQKMKRQSLKREKWRMYQVSLIIRYLKNHI